MLDKTVKICYNNYGERERYPHQIHKKEVMKNEILG